MCTKNKDARKDIEEIIQIRTEDTIFNVFLIKFMDEKTGFPEPTQEQMMKADGSKNPLGTILKTEMWQFKCNIKKIIDIAEKLKEECDANFTKLVPKLKKVEQKNPKQPIYLRVITTKDGPILKTIRSFF